MKMKKRVLTVFFLGFACISFAENVKKSVDNFNTDENGDNDESKDVAMEIPDIEPTTENKTQLCSARRQNHHMHPIFNATAKQFPFMVSCLSLSEDHLCSGTVISNGMILTTASCIQKQINAVLFNSISTKISHKDAVRVSVIKTEIFPSYNGEESLNDVGIVYTHKFNASVASKMRISNYTSAQNLIDVEILGYGLNAQAGTPQHLQYVGVENRFQSQPGNTLYVYIDCVETKEPTCFMDSGGPALFGNEQIGIIVRGSDNCIQEMTANYAINKEMAVILPTFSFKSWLDDKIKTHEEKNIVTIPTYPQKLVGIKKMSDEQLSSSGHIVVTLFTVILLCMFSLYFY